jgi:hypothetical protein
LLIKSFLGSNDSSPRRQTFPLRGNRIASVNIEKRDTKQTYKSRHSSKDPSGNQSSNFETKLYDMILFSKFKQMK